MIKLYPKSPQSALYCFYQSCSTQGLPKPRQLLIVKVTMYNRAKSATPHCVSSHLRNVMTVISWDPHPTVVKGNREKNCESKKENMEVGKTRL